VVQLLSSLLLPMLAFAAVGSSLLEPTSHCVAYRAEKVAFFLSKSEVVGRNCEVSAQVLPELGNVYRIEVAVPLRGFRSGDTDRDRDVMKILKAEVSPDLVFRTKALSADQWRDLFAKQTFNIDGDLKIGERTFPLVLMATYKEGEISAEVSGVSTVRFQDFDIKPPAVGAGFVARAKPELELHFHLMSPRILGADSIRLGNLKGKQ